MQFDLLSSLCIRNYPLLLQQSDLKIAVKAAHTEMNADLSKDAAVVQRICSLEPPPKPFPDDKRQAFNWLTTAYTLFWNMPSTSFENRQWKADIYTDYENKKKVQQGERDKSTQHWQAFSQALATLLVQDTDIISVAVSPLTWIQEDIEKMRGAAPLINIFVATNSRHR